MGGRHEWIRRDPQAGEGGMADSAGADSNAGGAGAADAGGASAGAGAGAGASDAGTGGGLLDASGAGSAADGALDIPEKFVVKNEAGEIDHQATARKMAESYRHLEKRVGTGDLPPKTADEYKIERKTIDGVEQADLAAMKPIVERFHAAGMTNKQVQEVMAVYDDLVEQGQSITKEKAAAATATLQKEWGDKYEANLSAANFALAAIATPEERAEVAKRYGAEPVIIKILAAAGRELKESPLTRMDEAETESIDSLRASEAYTNDRHPDHRRTVAKVNAAYQKGYKARH